MAGSARVAAYRSEEHRRMYVAARIALRMLLGACLAENPAAERFVREVCPRCGGPHGRPAVAGSLVHLSLPHGEGVALLGFAGTPIGVDIEKPPDQDALSRLVPCLHERERAGPAGRARRRTSRGSGPAWPGAHTSTASVPAAMPRC
ncbi:4'-phosphopantetheinyl transferase family protein [Streptomyces sp. NPDC088719]|uniref:4'-phosphopantetheinyl transferase family protein n=1 Tax=Streptomyces sp. NPDC088719 TaxID=3365872 RepID=UPI00380A5D68